VRRLRAPARRRARVADPISAEPGAGYLSRGDDGHGSFLEQIAALPATPRPSVVLIQGGRNDIGQPAAAEAVAVEKTLAGVRAKFGDPRIVMVGDIPASVPVGPRAVAANELLARVAHADHAQFIDPIRDRWISSADARAFRSDVPATPTTPATPTSPSACGSTSVSELGRQATHDEVHRRTQALPDHAIPLGRGGQSLQRGLVDVGVDLDRHDHVLHPHGHGAVQTEGARASNIASARNRADLMSSRIAVATLRNVTPRSRARPPSACRPSRRPSHHRPSPCANQPGRARPNRRPLR